MDSVDKLRKSLQACRRTEKTERPFDTYWITASACDQLIDEIEREVAERFVELPVDADGVPIRVGETCYDRRTGEPFEVSSVEWNGVCWSAWSKPEQRHIYSEVTHVKPRTVEDVLEEFIAAYDEWDCNTYDDERMAGRRELFAKYADELRELTGVDE